VRIGEGAAGAAGGGVIGAAGVELILF
jgi:hypothetical protein